MLVCKPYPISGFSSKNKIALVRLLFIFTAFILPQVKAFAYPPVVLNIEVNKYWLNDTTKDVKLNEGDYEDAPITLFVEGIGQVEISGLVFKDEVYLPVKDIFDFLTIRNYVSADNENINGYIIQPEAGFQINKRVNKIMYRGKTFILDPGEMIMRGGTLYLKSDYFGRIFGLNCLFDKYSLAVELTTKLVLPVIREKQLELMRNNLKLLMAEKKADTTIGRKFKLLNLGSADWSAFTSQATGEKPITWLSVGIGAALAGGELNLLLNYRSNQTLNLKQQFYQWRYVNNDHAALRQVTAGKLFTKSISSLFGAVIGLQFTNTPTTYKRSFGNYVISNVTEPGWTVELYVNNVLIDFAKADAAGFYKFDVPLIYGNTMIQLKFYGPWGEVQTSEKFVSVPFNFMPVHQFEYNVSAGTVEDDQKSKFSRVQANYGLNRYITLGGGVEYLSTANQGKTIPFINTSVKIGQHILFNGEYAHQTSSKLILSYRLPSNLQADLSYTWYDKNQTAIRTNYLVEKKLVVSMPVHAGKNTYFTRLTLNQFSKLSSQFIKPGYDQKNTTAELLISAARSGIGINLTSFAAFNKQDNLRAYSNISANINLYKGLRFLPQVQYAYDEHQISTVRIVLEKNILKRCNVNLAYEKIFINTVYANAVTASFRYDLAFAQTFSSIRKSKSGVVATQSARGGLLFDNKAGYLAANNQSGVGKGGIIFTPFLDVNNNGKRDPDEPAAGGVKVNINGGQIHYNKKDSAIMVTQLDAYVNYFAEVDGSGLQEVAWQIKNKKMNILVQPNEFKTIELPISIMGEVNGTVNLQDSAGTNGMGRIIVQIYNSLGELAGRTITEPDGYFSFMGLKPGLYIARIDAVQLQKFNWVSQAIPFTILAKTEGDFVSGIGFTLQLASN